jgi:hypothetical protein
MTRLEAEACIQARWVSWGLQPEKTGEACGFGIRVIVQPVKAEKQDASGINVLKRFHPPVNSNPVSHRFTGADQNRPVEEDGSPVPELILIGTAREVEGVPHDMDIAKIIASLQESIYNHMGIGFLPAAPDLCVRPIKGLSQQLQPFFEPFGWKAKSILDRETAQIVQYIRAETVPLQPAH